MLQLRESRFSVDLQGMNKARSYLFTHKIIHNKHESRGYTKLGITAVPYAENVVAVPCSISLVLKRARRTRNEAIRKLAEEEG